VEVQLHVFITSALDGGKWSASSPGSFTNWIVGWVGPETGLGTVAKRKNPFFAPAENLTPLVQPVA
jgi:hypothetical protein